MYYQAHKYPEAVETYKKSIQLNPNHADTWGGLGDAARFVKGMADQKAYAYERAIALKEGELKISPRDARLRADIASWLVDSNKKRALREIRIALGLNPKDSRVQATAALVYELSGMREKALTSLEQAIKLGHSVEEIQGWPPLEELRQDPRYKRIVSRSLEGATVKTSSN
jgi:tetratricopeptide (TPR) repeat protein